MYSYHKARLSQLWGLLKTRVVSPIDGSIEFISPATGHIGVRGPKDRIALTAYLDGTIAEVDPERGVVVEARASFIQGIFGVGGERVGALKLLEIPLDRKVTHECIPVDVSGCVLVGGHSPTVEALRVAASRGAVGFVTGSIDDATLKEYVGYDIGVAITGDEPVPMTVIITEGFGAIPMNITIEAIMREINGTRVSIHGAIRPEIIGAPVRQRQGNSSGSVDESWNEGLRVGGIVRVIRVPYFGQRGVITQLPRELERIETGASARVARLKLEADGRVITVPRANVEIV